MNHTPDDATPPAEDAHEETREHPRATGVKCAETPDGVDEPHGYGHGV